VARTVNTEVRAVRREAFVDAALRLIQQKGYEQMSVQDVLDAVSASRGAFYHYFDSKDALLEAVLERMSDVVLAGQAPLVNDPNVPALEKLERLFAGIAQWKNRRKELMTALLRVWLSDDNAIVREKFRKAMVLRMVPLLGAIIRQGKAEGVFAVSSPEHAARSVWSLMQGAQEVAGELLLARQANVVPFEAVEATFAAYAEGFERIVGVPPGSIHVVDDATLRLWFG
jgi:AcrR family transcriptional regulator